MRNLTYILLISGASLFLPGCDKHEATIPGEKEENQELPQKGDNKPVPEGYFEVVFSSPISRTEVIGADKRIQHLRYLLFRSTGEFVKETEIIRPSDNPPTWPISVIRDTLPRGDYRAVFTGNTVKELFPYPTPESSFNYNEVLTGYQAGYASGRIILPNTEFAENTEYYMANVTFSDTSPTPHILLQRIISKLKLHRNFIDAQTALNTLTYNIVTHIKYRNIIQTKVSTLLPTLIRNKLDKGSTLLNNIAYGGVTGGLDAIVNSLTEALTEPVTEALYQQLLQQLVNQIGLALSGNANQEGALATLGVLLNPWADSQADAAIVSINNFPKSINFDLNVMEYFSGIHKFKFRFTGKTVYDEKDILIKGFNGIFDIRSINVVKQGLVAGVIIDQGIDNPWLLNGTFIDVNDSISSINETNRRYQSDYSFTDLKLKSYEQQTNEAHTLTLSVQLSAISNLDSIVKELPLLGPLLGSITSLILNPLKTITVNIPVNLPLLGVSNLSLSNSWLRPVSSY